VTIQAFKTPLMVSTFGFSMTSLFGLTVMPMAAHRFSPFVFSLLPMPPLTLCRRRSALLTVSIM
jgi:hypothetical protein